MPLIVSTPGKRYRYRDLEFWAERGLVHFFDFRGNPYEPDYKKVAVKDVLLRAKAISEGLGRIKWPDEREEQTRLVEDFVRVCHDAKRQGRPDDPRTWEHVKAMRDKRVLYAGPGARAGNYRRTEGDTP